jgi:resuscitation-promoting factor RpfA
MRCPRCQSETGPGAIRCADCGAPLALGDEAPPRALDRPLHLDRPPRPSPVIELHRGDATRRVLAWLVDGLPFVLTTGAVAAWLGATEPGLLAPLAAVAGLASFTYQTLATWLAGATVGKRLTGLRVVGPDGARPGLGRSALRSAVAVLGVAALGAGPLTALFTRSGRALHDLVADTAVVEAP